MDVLDHRRKSTDLQVWAMKPNGERRDAGSGRLF
jgi:hypothetical protein